MVLSPVFVIAEAGVNHNGDLDLACRLIDAAQQAGADAVKFQSFEAENLVARGAAKAGYQSQRTGAEESQFEMLKKLELSKEDHHALKALCDERGIAFLSTPFDAAAAQFLVKELAMTRLKIASGEITNAPFLMAVSQLGVPLILSTGMSDFSEIDTAVRIIAHGLTVGDGPPDLTAQPDKNARAQLRKTLTLLHCTSQYPAPLEETNLNVLPEMATRFGVDVGLSDHTPGSLASLGAVALGAKVIEKHLTLDRQLPGPDHAASLEPGEFNALVRDIRAMEAALGSPEKQAQNSELPNRDVARRSLVAIRPIKKGEVFDEANVGAKRPGSGLPPTRYWDVLGRKAERDYELDDPIANDALDR